MAQGDVWVSRIMVDSTLIKEFDSDVHLADKNRAVDAMVRSRRGEPLPADRFPKEMYGKYFNRNEKRQPCIFAGGGFYNVTAEAADVLRSVDLGRTSLYPVKLLQHDRKTPVKGEYFCINFGETKDTFVPDFSSHIHRHGKDMERWSMMSRMRDDHEIAVTEAALAGPDFWIEAKLERAVFMSDRLAQALREAGLSRRFGLRSCKLVRLN